MMILSMGDDRSEDKVEKKPEVTEKSEIHRRVQQYIGRRYEIYLTDGRIIRGALLATDKDANMVFNQADERWTESAATGVRYLGQAMISKKYVVKMILMPEPKIIKVEEIKREKAKSDGAVEPEKETTEAK